MTCSKYLSESTIISQLEELGVRVKPLSPDALERADYDMEYVNSIPCKYFAAEDDDEDQRPNQPFNGIIVSDKLYHRLITQISNQVIGRRDEVLHNKFQMKWSGPQGGTASRRLMFNNLIRYYNRDGDEMTWNEELFDKSKRLFSEWLRKNFIGDITDAIIKTSGELFATYVPTHKSIGGVTSSTDRKSDKNHRIKAVKQAQEMPTQYDPLVAGYRYKDGKPRSIFIDSTANYFREMKVLFRLFNWFRQLPFDHHYSDQELEELIVTFQAKAAYGGDYKGMDFHLTWKEFSASLQYICEILNVPGDQISYIIMSMEELFYADVICVDTVWSGLHNLLSGIYPTHYIECIINLMKCYYVCHELGFTVITRYRKLKSNEAFIFVNGDDSMILFGSEVDSELCGKIHADISAATGQIMEESKIDYSTESIAFCKRIFALRRGIKGFKNRPGTNTPASKYSVAKCLHALRYPEQIPHFPHSHDLIIWMASIMDCSWGSTGWESSICQIVDQHKAWFQAALSEILDEGILQETLDELSKDWWFANYADFKVSTSPTIQFMTKILLG